VTYISPYLVSITVCSSPQATSYSLSGILDMNKGDSSSLYPELPS